MTPDPTPPSTLTLAGCLAGARLVAPSLPGIVAFAFAFGAGSVEKGLTAWENLGMSLFVAAGASQMLSLELWRDSWTLGTLLTIVGFILTDVLYSVVDPRVRLE